MEKICRNCKYWEEDKAFGITGECSCPKFIHIVKKATPENGFGYWIEASREDLSGIEHQVEFETGRKFGCIHFTGRENGKK